jgi:cell wall-associated NlpC family hydrolase
MFTKILSVAFLLLMSNCLESQYNDSTVALNNTLNIAGEVNRNDVITYAKKFLGTTYRYAGTDMETGFDCSGFVYFVFSHFNIHLPRGSADYLFLGAPLKPEEFKVGDVLVFYGYLDHANIGHVGIISEANGMSSKFIHATSGKTYGVTISNLNSEMYTRRFYKCIDVMD